jgi:hypothetical protein
VHVYMYCEGRLVWPLVVRIGRVVVGSVRSLWVQGLTNCGVFGVSVGVTVWLPGTLLVWTELFPFDLDFR